MRYSSVTRPHNFLLSRNLSRSGFSGFGHLPNRPIWHRVGVFLMHFWIGIHQASSTPCLHFFYSLYPWSKHRFLFHPFQTEPLTQKSFLFPPEKYKTLVHGLSTTVVVTVCWCKEGKFWVRLIRYNISALC